MSRDRLSNLLVCVALFLGTLLLYLPAFRFDFVNYDDPDYLIHNFHINRGLSQDALIWAFNVGYAGNWHPLTWISHALDCQWFGLESPGAHHATNVVFHAFSATLLFLILRRSTKTLWRAAFVAAVFAWHPLRVESVAWVSERKDVLCAAFWMLTTWAYLRYCEQSPTARGERTVFYGLALFLFALGLMSKPMIVTLPFTLLLLDWWPLHRISFPAKVPARKDATGLESEIVPLAPNGDKAQTAGVLAGRLKTAVETAALPKETGPSGPNVSVRRQAIFLVFEKIPFFILALCACVVTLQAQKGAIQSLAHVPLSLRLLNAVEAYFNYVRETIWPAGLAIIYPLKTHVEGVDFVVPLIFVGVVSVVAWRLRTARPWWAVGWLWYLGTLVPVINLVQIGSQAMADRYSYIPSIGLLLILCWETYDISTTWPDRRVLLQFLGAVVLAGCFITTRIQLQYWKNSGALFAHAIDVTPGNFIAMVNDAAYLRDQQQYEQAQRRCEDAIRVFSDYAGAHFMLGTVLYSEGRLEPAAAELETALRLDPSHYAAHYVLAGVDLARNLPEEAAQHFAAALPHDPANPDVRAGLGNAFAMEGRLDEAVAEFDQALSVSPRSLDPRYQLAIVLARQRKWSRAINEYRTLLGLSPEYRNAMANLAWILATAPERDLRDGNAALSLASRACSVTKSQQPVPLKALAAAYAELGRFDDAVPAAQRAHDLAAGQGDSVLAGKCAELLAVLRARQPYRE